MSAARTLLRSSLKFGVRPASVSATFDIIDEIYKQKDPIKASIN